MISSLQIHQKRSEETALQHETTNKSAKHASLRPQEIDSITEKLKREYLRTQPRAEMGKLRAVKSLGAWAGASLMSLMKIQPCSIIEKEQWAQNGASKFYTLGEPSLSSQRKSIGPGAIRSGVEEKSGWTLGIWGY